MQSGGPGAASGDVLGGRYGDGEGKQVVGVEGDEY